MRIRYVRYTKEQLKEMAQNIRKSVAQGYTNPYEIYRMASSMTIKNVATLAKFLHIHRGTTTLKADLKQMILDLCWDIAVDARIRA